MMKAEKISKSPQVESTQPKRVSEDNGKTNFSQSNKSNPLWQQMVHSDAIAVQPTLTIGAQNDVYEREADQVATQVVAKSGQSG